MPGEAEDYIRAGREWLAQLDLDEDQRAALQKSMTDVRVAVAVDFVGVGALTAYERAKAEAERLWAWTALTEAYFDANEPEELAGGVLQVGVLVGVTELDPADAVRSACAVLAGRAWSEPSPRAIAEHQFSCWAADPRPPRGLVRIEVHAAPGLTPITERDRQEMLADPTFAHLHGLLDPP